MKKHEITEADILLAAKEVVKITGLKKFMLVGAGSSCFTLGPETTAITNDIDVFTPEDELRALDEVIEKLGEGSNFHEKNNFFIERVGSWTVVTQPKGWEKRAHIIQLPEIDAEIHVLSLMDLVYNKLETGRKKDLEFIKRIIQNKKVDPKEIRHFLDTCEIDGETRKEMIQRFKSLAPLPPLGHPTTGRKPPKLIKAQGHEMAG